MQDSIKPLFILAVLAAACGSTPTAASLQLSDLPAATIAGQSLQVQVAAVDSNGNRVTDYTGTIHFSSSNLQLTVPADYTFAPGDSGAQVFAMVIETPGPVSLSVSDVMTPSLTATASTTTAAPALTGISVSIPPAIAPGQAFDVQVTVTDIWGGPATLYTGTVHFTSTDPLATLPADYTFTAADQGAHVFSGGATFQTDGAQDLAVADTADSLSAQSPGATVQ